MTLSKTCSFKRSFVLVLLLAGSTLGVFSPAFARQINKPKPADSKATTGKEAAAPVAPVLTEDNEVRMGRENAEENDKQVKFVTDAAMVERVNRIGQEIAAVANKMTIPALWGSPKTKNFNYSFKVVDDKDVNAYSLPGGYIYVNKGLIDYVHSDDELAGVLAHEVTHAMHHHMVKLLHEQAKIDRVMLPIKLLTLAGMVMSRGNAGDAQNILLGTQLYSIAKLNTYGVEAEKDADHGGVLLLLHTHYNPVGLYSFMLRNAADEQRQGPTELGIFRTHPPGTERAAATKKLLDENNVAIRLSEVDPKLKASITLTKDKTSGMELAEIKMRDIVLCRVAAADGLTAEQRAQRIAASLNTLVDANLQPFEIKTNPDRTKVLARRVSILTEADAQAQNTTVAALAQEFSNAMSQYMLKKQIDSGI